MASPSRGAACLFLFFASSVAMSTATVDVSKEFLAADDECAVGSCGLNALQFNRGKLQREQATCDTETRCHGCSGESCQLCREEEQVKCCMNDGGSASHCCANVNPQIKFRATCMDMR
mmetsp:Transcript_93419/g.273514  ORF Transcript_93419/g.273514 Transcript_93419/m.273514 type:complete len:118 (-) Transcript_93419:128-481(-)